MATMTRREFMRLAGWAATVTGFAAVAIPIVAYFYPKNLEEVPSEPVPVGMPDELGVGESKLIPYGRYPALIIHTEEGVRAYSAVCTHFACLVKWNAEDGMIECPCHEGYFDPLDGSVISGPPPRALDAFPTFIGEDGQLYVGEEQQTEGDRA
ncbi:MAG: Rieske (2Fe-2S) protein [Anaerolineae bacterium]